VATNYIWHVIWCYADANGKLSAEMAADFILALAAASDGAARPDMNDARTKVGNNFATPAGNSIVFRLISSGQCGAVYS
jgi:hypothetical protein